MTIEEILNLSNEDVMKLTKEELQPLVRQTVGATRKRIKRIEESGIKFSPATQAVKNFDFSTSEKQSLNQLRQQFIKSTDFLKMKTSTLKGAREARKRTMQTLGMSEKEYSKLGKQLWNILKEVRNKYPELMYGNHKSTDIINYYYELKTQGAKKKEIKEKIFEMLNIPKEAPKSPFDNTNQEYTDVASENKNDDWEDYT